MKTFATTILLGVGFLCWNVAPGLSTTAPKKPPRVLTVTELPKSQRSSKTHWISVRALDRNASVISIEVKDNLENSFVADGTCDTIKQGRRTTDGRTTVMDVPIDKRHTQSTATIEVRAYSIDCNKPRRQKRGQYGNWKSFSVPIGDL